MDAFANDKLMRLKGKRLEENDADTEEDSVEKPTCTRTFKKSTVPSLHKTNARFNLTSDYDSSNESPSGSELTIDESQLTNLHSESSLKLASQDKSFFVPKPDTCVGPSRRKCSLCGAVLGKDTPEQVEGKFKKSSLRWPFVDLPPPLVPQLNQKGHYMIDSVCYDLEEIHSNPLLSRINEWDYPIFELQDSLGDTVLSKMAYYVFLHTGIMEAFRIPTAEFLLYLHALECGYRHKPCKCTYIYRSHLLLRPGACHLSRWCPL